MIYSLQRKFPRQSTESLISLWRPDANRGFYRLKLKRPQTAKKYRDVIDEMYAEIEQQGTPAKAKL